MENDPSSTQEVKITPDANLGMLKQFYRDAVMVLTEPTAFFKGRYESMSFNYALAFGMAISWIAAFIDWVTRALKHESLMDGFLKIKDQLHSLPIWKDLPEDIWTQGSKATSIMPEWGMEGLRMLINPFHSLISYFIYGVIFWLGASLLVTKENPAKKSVTIHNVVKITAISSAATIVGAVLGFLPFEIGSLVGWIFHTVILTIGISESFNVSRPRGLAVVFLPTIITIVFFSCLVGIMVALFAGVIASLLH
jgi:hypothetical protein